MQPIDRLDVRWVRLPDHFRSPGADTTVLVGAALGDEVRWGEARCGDEPCAEEEFHAGVFTALVELIGPRVVGRLYSTVSAFHESLGALRGCRFARAAVEAAAEPAAAGEPATDGRLRPLAKLPWSRNVAELIEVVERLTSRGVTEFVVSIGPGTAAELLRPLRAAAPEAVLHLDGDERFDDYGLGALYGLDDFSPASLIQPLPVDDLTGSAMLQSQLRVPLVLRRGALSEPSLGRAIDLGAGRGVLLHAGRCGGGSPTAGLASVARDADWSVICESPEGAVACDAALRIASAIGVERLAAPADWLGRDDRLALHEGMLAADSATPAAEALLAACADEPLTIARRVLTKPA